MKYKFELQKNIFMYNHNLICTDDKNTYHAICESCPTKEETIAFWPEDFRIPPEELEIFVQELKEWATSQGYKYIINSGKGR